MRPPICAICGKRFKTSEEGGLLSFSLTKSDNKWKKKSKQPGFVGHPPWREYFCNKHYEEAAKLSHLTLPEAMKKLYEIFKEETD